jgi:hypothetical protein
MESLKFSPIQDFDRCKKSSARLTASAELPGQDEPNLSSPSHRRRAPLLQDKLLSCMRNRRARARPVRLRRCCSAVLR